jgi:hypothetical protein
MPRFLVSYICMMVALMLTLDFLIAFFIVASLFVIQVLYLHEISDTTASGLTTFLRSVCRIE